MPFSLSPAVNVREIDRTNVVPAVATSIAAIVAPFDRGPVGSIIPISSEEELVETFGRPNENNFEQWFCASNFLQYGNALRVLRINNGLVNATANGTAALVEDDGYENQFLGSTISPVSALGDWTARSAGTWGNSLAVSVCPSGAAYESRAGGDEVIVDAEVAAGSTSLEVSHLTNNSYDLAGTSDLSVGDIISFLNSTFTSVVDGENGQEYEVTNITGNVITFRRLDNPNGGGTRVAIPANTSIQRRWRFYDVVNNAPGQSVWSANNDRASNDELHVVVYDVAGEITRTRNALAGQRLSSVIEVYENVSKNPNARSPQGSNIYYPNVIFIQSAYIYWTRHNAAGTNWGDNLDSSTSYVDPVAPLYLTLAGGTIDYTMGVADYTPFLDVETIDINLVIGGKTPDDITAGLNHATSLIDLVDARKDAVAFISPARSDVVGVASAITQTTNVRDFFNQVRSSSYAVFDSGYKYQYDEYNDVYRFVPLNGDIAGLCANTDLVADSWFSPAGNTRGLIRGAIRLAYEPDIAQRDILYRARINPVVTFQGQGSTLWGDKTALSRASSFDRINVRRLFITLEKAIATAARQQLFEQNDEFTRAAFRNLIEPFLRDVQGRRGITAFSVVPREPNTNAPNTFTADIFVTPINSINNIILNFIATRDGVSFTEIAG